MVEPEKAEGDGGELEDDFPLVVLDLITFGPIIQDVDLVLGPVVEDHEPNDGKIEGESES